jgi:uncharacterized membrane protein
LARNYDVRHSREIIVLLALLVGAIAGVSWYVIDRRARARTAPPARPAATQPMPFVELTSHEHKTIDFSSGQPVVKDSPEDRAAIDAALKDMEEATKDVTFGPPPRKEEPPEKK